MLSARRNCVPSATHQLHSGLPSKEFPPATALLDLAPDCASQLHGSDCRFPCKPAAAETSGADTAFASSQSRLRTARDGVASENTLASRPEGACRVRKG